MKCCICGTDDWKNVDEFRDKPAGMAMCNGCGFISYPAQWKSEEDLKEFYRKDYRKPPTIQNLHTGQRKLHFHNAFLKEIFKVWAETGKEAPVVGEIGAAFGMFLNFVRDQFPKADLNGTELTKSFRRNAYHEFGLNLTEELDLTKKYDLISSYKVAEHQCDIDKYLRQYVEALKPDGVLYISVPTWLGRLNNFGAPGFTLEYYYHPNHINVWTRKLFETLLKKVGAKIVKYDGSMYDDTYLCVRDDELMKEEPVYEDPTEILKRLTRVKKAGDAFAASRYDEAIEAWPDFPDAHAHRYETRRAEFHKLGFDGIKKEVFDVALKCCPGSPEIYYLIGDVSWRYERFHDAVLAFEQMLILRPANTSALHNLAKCHRSIGLAAFVQGEIGKGFQGTAKARNIMKYLREVSAADEVEAVNRIYDDNAKLPTPFEVA